jgi:hypothetical protein
MKTYSQNDEKLESSRLFDRPNQLRATEQLGKHMRARGKKEKRRRWLKADCNRTKQLARGPPPRMN